MSNAAAPDIIPTLRYRDAAKAIQWLTEAFGFTQTLVVHGADDTIAHAQLSHGTGMIMLGSETDGGDGRLVLEQGPSSIYVIVDDIEEHYRKARETGVEVIRELEEESYGGYGFTVRDFEQNIWSLGTYRPARG